MTENSVSQGPAREETLDKIITDILKLHGHPVTHNSKALARELFDAGAQSRTPTNLESRTGPDDLRIWAHTESLRADVAEARLKDLESRTVAPQPEPFHTVAPQPEPFHLRKLLHEVGIVCQCGSVEEWTVQGIRERLRKVMHEYGVAIGRVELAGAAALPSTPDKGYLIAAEELEHSRTAWLEQHGVPISMEFVRFANAIGDAVDLLRGAASVPAASSQTPKAQAWMTEVATSLMDDYDTIGLQTHAAAVKGIAEIIAKHYAASSPESNQGWIAVETSKPVIAASCLFWVTGREFWEAGYYRGENPNCWECERTDAMDEKIYYSEGEVSYWMIPAPPVASQPAKPSVIDGNARRP